MNRREFNRRETVRYIREVFIRLYEKGGIGGVTVNELCRECGIAKSTFYLYFDDKYAVLQSIEDELLSTLRGICSSLDYDRSEVLSGRPLEKAVLTARVLRENADAFRALLGRHGDPLFVFKWKKYIEEDLVESARLEHGDSPGAGIACAIFSSSLIGLYTHVLFAMPDVTDKELSIIMGNLLKHVLYDFHAFEQ